MHASSDSLVNDIYLVEGYCILFILVISHTLHNMHLQMINSKTYSQIFFLTVFQLITEHIKTPPIKSVCGDNISCPTCGYSWQVWLAFCACSSCYILKKKFQSKNSLHVISGRRQVLLCHGELFFLDRCNDGLWAKKQRKILKNTCVSVNPWPKRFKHRRIKIFIILSKLV